MPAGSTYHPVMDPATLAAHQRQQADKITPEAAKLNSALQQLPAYKQYVQDVLLGHAPPNGRSEALVEQAKAAGIDIPDSLIFDPYTGQVREKIWNEENSGWSGLIYVGVAIAAGLTAGAAVGAFAGGAAAAGSGVGVGETAAATGLTGATLPGAVAIPTVADLATTGSAIGGIGTTAAETGSTLGTIGNTLKNPSTIGKIAGLAGLASNGIADATRSAGNTQQSNVNTGLTANAQNINGQNAFENQLLARAHEEDTQRGTALKNVYRDSFAHNPRVSPYNPAGAPTYSPSYLDTVGALGKQGADTLSKPGQYATGGMPALKPYTPYDPNSMSGPGGTQPSTMQNIGNWLAPTLSTISAIAKILGR